MGLSKVIKLLLLYKKIYILIWGNYTSNMLINAFLHEFNRLKKMYFEMYSNNVTFYDNFLKCPMW